MSVSHRLGAVIRHELKTIIGQPSFWISIFALPVILAIALGVGWLTSRGETKAELNEKTSYNIVVFDHAGIINPELATATGLQLGETGTEKATVERVARGELDGVLIYPEGVTGNREFYRYANTDDGDIGKPGKITALGSELLRFSVAAQLGDERLTGIVMQGGVSRDETYRGGELQPGFGAFVAPGAFLLLFYAALVMSVGYAMTSVSEEKENRAIEMVLSNVNPRTLMIGKLIGTTLITLVMFMSYIAVGVAAYFVARKLGSDISLPFRLEDLVFEAKPIIFGFLYFLFGFVLFIALMLGVGAAFPSSREAAGFSTIFYILPALPFWAFNTVISQPDALYTQFVTYFPLSAPTALLLRNTVGNIGVAESVIGLGVLGLSVVIAIWAAGKVLKMNALNFDSAFNLRNLFRRS